MFKIINCISTSLFLFWITSNNYIVAAQPFQQKFGKITISDSSWSKPVQIPIDQNDRSPVGADITAGRNGLYMTFQTYTPDIFTPHDVWLISYKKETWGSPQLVTNTSFTASGSKVIVSEGGQGDIIHLIWWDKPSEQTYTIDHLPSEDETSEIWYASLENGKIIERLKIFEGNHFTPKLTKPVNQKDGKSFYFTVYAGKNDENNDIPFLYLAGKDAGKWNTYRPITLGGGREASMALVSKDKFIVAYREPEFEWAKKNFQNDWRGIFIKTTENRGKTWSEPFLIERNEWKQTETAQPEIIADGAGGVHLFWRQDTTGDNYADNLAHTWTADGETWSEVQLFENNLTEDRAFIHNFDVATTSTGVVHLIYTASKDIDKESNKLVHLVWNVQNWSTPQIIIRQRDIKNPVLAYNETKNKLHLVFHALDESDPVHNQIKEWNELNIGQGFSARSGYERFADWSWYHSVFTSNR